MFLCDMLMMYPLEEIARIYGNDLASYFRGRMRKVSAATRFIIDDDLIPMIADVALSKPSSILSIMEVFRWPYPLMWIEWLEAPRTAALKGRGTFVPNGKHIPKRFGFLVETDEEGRKGVINLCWCHESERRSTEWADIEMPGLCIRFDYDAPPGPYLPDSTSRWAKYTNDPVEVDAMKKLTGGVFVDKADDADLFYRPLGHVIGMERLKFMIQSHTQDQAGEYVYCLSAGAMLVARNGATQERTDLSRLNKARVKAGKVPLLDHYVVRMRLTPAERKALKASPGERSGPRAHVVRGHYVTRGKLIYWRRSHVRGHGDVATKTAYVKP